MLLENVPRALLCPVAAYFCFYAPGHGLVPASCSNVPTAFARILASVIVSTLVGTSLAAAGLFSLPALLILNGAVAAAGLLSRRGAVDADAATEGNARRDLVGPLVFVLALGAYWPAYPTFLGASDATVYAAAGVSLARHGTLALDDGLGPQVPVDLRPVLFDSMTQVVGSHGPPYRRMPGGIVIDSLDATRAWPAFFPVPQVWSAAFVSAWAPVSAESEHAAPAYAPVFAALALWAFWLLARAWMGTVPALAAVVLLGASMPFYTNARMSLSEPIAAFFSISGLAMLSRRDATPNRGDAILAGAALGAAVFTRVETALVLLLAFALLPSVEPSADGAGGNGAASRRLPRAFVASLVAVAALTIVQAATVPGTYVTPLLEHALNARAWRLRPWDFLMSCFGWERSLPIPLIDAIYAAVLVAVVVAVARRLGWSATLRWGFVVAVLAGHAMAAPFEVMRTPTWLAISIGWPGLLLAAAGAVLAWRERARLAAAPVVLSVAAAVAAILFYNPHVYPELSWGTRRFVPLLLPLVVLLACYTVSRAGARSRVLSVALLGLFAWQVAAAGTPVWGQRLLEGTHETLERLDASIPAGGTIFIDREISSMMIGPALWLLRDRNSITVPPTTGPGANKYIPALVRALAGQGTVYLVTQGPGSQKRVPFVRMKLISTQAVGFPYLEAAYDRRPRQILRIVRMVGVYRLESVDDPRGELIE